MKKIFILLFGIVFSITILNAQDAPPQAFSYKATITKTLPNGNIVAVVSKTVGLKIIILQDDPGTPAYSETFNAITNSSGQIDIVIGRNPDFGYDFSQIKWSEDIFFLQVWVDINGGTAYGHTPMSITQLLSVPYALYAGTAGSSLTGDYNNLQNKPTNLSQFNNDPGFLINETDPVFRAHDAAVITSDAIVNWNTTTWIEIADKPTTIAGFGISDAVSTTGDQIIAGNKTFSGTISAGLHNIINVGDPLNAHDAATKAYVDALELRISELEETTSELEQILSDAGLGPLTDIMGNEYRTVIIGTQVWMAENLKTTKFNDGTNIPIIVNDLEWSLLSTPGCCWFDNDSYINRNVYGALYNWLAVDNGKLCPMGWHVPSDAEFTTLLDYLGGYIIAGGKLKSTTLWPYPNAGATDAVHFTALPGGCRIFDGTFDFLQHYGYWWSSTGGEPNNAIRYLMDYQDEHVSRTVSDRRYGMSVRCIKD